MSKDEQNKIAFLKQFIGREDAFASRKAGGRAYTAQKRPITDEDLRRHLTEYGPHIATYLMAEGSDKTRHATFDLDDHDASGEWSQMQEIAKLLSAELRNFGYEPIPFRSGGGHGIHLWLLWEGDQLAADVRHMMNHALSSIGFEDGTEGIAKKQIEIFPKQDRVSKKQYGSAVALPLARKSVSLSSTFEPLG